MKTLKLFSLLLISSLIFFACEKSDIEVPEKNKKNCEFVEADCEIKPFCVWPPAPNTPVPLPVGFLYKGEIISHENFNIEWSSNPTFRSGAISLEYDDIPVTAKVTEIATGCVVELTLGL